MPSSLPIVATAVLVACAIHVGVASAAEPAGDAAPIKVGIVGLDTSHATAFARMLNAGDDPEPVSYTHLTLPTIYSV